MMNTNFIVLTLLVSAGINANARKPKTPKSLSSATEKPKYVIPKSDAKKTSKYKTYTAMSYEELEIAKNEQLKHHNNQSAIKYLERLITLCDDINKKADHILELADLYLEQSLYEDATKWYTEFTTLYPGSKQIEYATYKAIVCSSQRILSPDRDQTVTHETLALCDSFLERQNIFTTHLDEVRNIKNTCNKTLSQSELYISTFYINHGDYQSAQMRLKGIRNDWLIKLPEIETELALLEVQLGEVFKEFVVPESALKIAAATQPTKKIDLVARF